MIESTNWLTKGISEEQLKYEKTCALVSSQIRTKRYTLGMEQSDFAKYFGVTTKKLREWESGLHDFTEDEFKVIKEKLDMFDAEKK